MNIKVQFFGMVAELVGMESLQIEAFNGSLLREVETHLLQEYPSLGSLTYSMSLNKQIVSGDASLGDYNEIALLPPFSGG